MKSQEFFFRQPVFSYEEFVAFHQSGRRRSLKTIASILSYYVETGRVQRVRRGLYVAVPPGADRESFEVDPYLLAAKMADDAFLAYHTAAEFHGKAYSVHEQFQYLTDRASRPVVFRGYYFRGVSFPKILRQKNQQMFGTYVTERAGVDIRVTSLERTLVDLLDRPDLGGGWEEIWRSLEMIEFLDLDQVVEYVLLLGNATTAAKVGFYLEQHQEELMVSDAYLERLRDQRPRGLHYMTRRERTPGRLMTAWHLVIPPEILERSWQEVL